MKSEYHLHRYKYLPAIILAVLLSSQSAIGQTRHSQTPNPLAGQWHCTATSMRMPAFKNIPAGSIAQSISYKADTQGHWISNSILQYQADKSNDCLRIHSTASGVHAVSGAIVTEHIQRFRINQPLDTSTAFARAAAPTLHTMLVAMMQRNKQQRYRLLQQTPTQYVMQPLTSSGTETAQRITCQKVGIS